MEKNADRQCKQKTYLMNPIKGIMISGKQQLTKNKYQAKASKVKLTADRR